MAYGVVGALAVVLLLQLFGGSEEEAVDAIATADTDRVEDISLPPVAPGEIRDAPTVADYETLVAEGDRAVGQVVRTELFCGSISSRSVRQEVEGAHPALLALADAEGRVAGAECRWSREGRSDEFLLIVPPALATEFAGAPEEELNFVRRRRIIAHVEWLGRSEALALRYAGLLRDLVG